MKADGRTSDVKSRILHVCNEAQEELGGNNDAVLCVLNGLMQAMSTYTVLCTTGDREIGQTRFNELSEKIGKVSQEFFTKYAGGALMIELDPPDDHEITKRWGNHGHNGVCRKNSGCSHPGELRVKKEAANSFAPPTSLDVTEEGEEIVVRLEKCAHETPKR